MNFNPSPMIMYVCSRTVKSAVGILPFEIRVNRLYNYNSNILTFLLMIQISVIQNENENVVIQISSK